MLFAAIWRVGSKNLKTRLLCTNFDILRLISRPQRVKNIRETRCVRFCFYSTFPSKIGSIAPAKVTRENRLCTCNNFALAFVQEFCFYYLRLGRHLSDFANILNFKSIVIFSNSFSMQYLFLNCVFSLISLVAVIF